MATLWPRDQTAVFTVEEPTVSKTKEGSLGQESNQKHTWGIYLQGCTKLVPTGWAFKSNSTSSIVIRCMRVNLVKRSELWRNGNWTLQYGNVRLPCLQQQLSLLISLQRLPRWSLFLLTQVSGTWWNHIFACNSGYKNVWHSGADVTWNTFEN